MKGNVDLCKSQFNPISTNFQCCFIPVQHACQQIWRSTMKSAILSSRSRTNQRLQEAKTHLNKTLIGIQTIHTHTWPLHRGNHFISTNSSKFTKVTMILFITKKSDLNTCRLRSSKLEKDLRKKNIKRKSMLSKLTSQSLVISILSS